MVRNSFSTAALAQLIHRLRFANARYGQLALQCRYGLRPTYHAKRRAYWAGLRIDTNKARNCPGKYVSRQPLPIIDTTPSSAAGDCLSVSGGNTLGLELTNLPEVTVPSRTRPNTRLTIRIPPLNFNYGCDYPSLDPSIPGAPLLRPMQLPEDDTEMEDISLENPSSPSSTSSSDSLLTPIDTNLRIHIPARGPKRKLHEVEAEDSDSDALQQPKRAMRVRWSMSQNYGNARVRV
ncbi:hypothetical protein F5I97DRAFT_1930305 [Phlebopus sp. FC_14]|nr:hypothetical protein F5I97DRAFT_1930305 [Phlebopus sp. FC_14]